VQPGSRQQPQRGEGNRASQKPQDVKEISKRSSKPAVLRQGKGRKAERGKNTVGHRERKRHDETPAKKRDIVTQSRKRRLLRTCAKKRHKKKHLRLREQPGTVLKRKPSTKEGSQRRKPLKRQRPR